MNINYKLSENNKLYFNIINLFDEKNMKQLKRLFAIILEHLILVLRIILVLILSKSDKDLIIKIINKNSSICFLITLLVFSRLIPHPPNFTPIISIVILGGILFHSFINNNCFF